MTTAASPLSGGRKLIFLAVLVAVLAIFATSLYYRLDNPSLKVQINQGNQQPPAGMGEMPAEMSRIKDLMAKVEQDPNDFGTLVELGGMFVMMQAWDRAGEFLEKAAAIEPENDEVLMPLGMVYFRTNEFAKAADLFSGVVQRDETNAVANFNLGVLYKHYLEKPELAQKHFKAALDNSAKDSELHKSAHDELENQHGG